MNSPGITALTHFATFYGENDKIVNQEHLAFFQRCEFIGCFILCQKKRPGKFIAC